jgi:hypothetical protein
MKDDDLSVQHRIKPLLKEIVPQTTKMFNATGRVW